MNISLPEVHEEVFGMFHMNKTNRDRALFRVLCAVPHEIFVEQNLDNTDRLGSNKRDRNTSHYSSGLSPRVTDDNEDSGDELVVTY